MLRLARHAGDRLRAAGRGADYPAPQQGDWVAKDFKFHTGETMPELKLHYTTLGDPRPGRADAARHHRFGRRPADARPSPASCSAPGQPLDATKYFIIMPDGIGHGRSTKPSDGLRAKFPRYDYDDMVEAQYRLLTEGLGIKHLRLVMGNSMGGMQSWLWAGSIPTSWTRRADGVAADRDGGAQLDDAPADHRRRSATIPTGTAATTRRSPGACSAPRCSSASPRRAARWPMPSSAPTRAAADKMLDERLAAPCDGRRQRLALPVGIVGRLRSVAGPGAHHRQGAGDQLGRRRAQPARDRPHRAGDEAGEERPPLPDPGQHRDPRSRHHRQREVLHQASWRSSCRACPPCAEAPP